MLKVIQFVHVPENSFEGSYTIGREGRPGHKSLLQKGDILTVLTLTEGRYTDSAPSYRMDIYFVLLLQNGDILTVLLLQNGDILSIPSYRRMRYTHIAPSYRMERNTHTTQCHRRVRNIHITLFTEG